jgi:hypothetical protein
MESSSFISGFKITTVDGRDPGHSKHLKTKVEIKL